MNTEMNTPPKTEKPASKEMNKNVAVALVKGLLITSVIECARKHASRLNEFAKNSKAELGKNNEELQLKLGFVADAVITDIEYEIARYKDAVKELESIQ